MFKIKKILCLRSSKKYVSYLRSLGAHIGVITRFVSPAKIHFDEGRSKYIYIGDSCTICCGVSILAHDHSFSVFSHLGEPLLFTKAVPVIIGNNVFVGENSTILCGVTIGDNVIIGAGSVVSKDIPSNSIAYGNPCTTIGSINDFYIKKKNEIMDVIFNVYRKFKKINGYYPSERDLSQYHLIYGVPFTVFKDNISLEFNFKSFHELNDYIINILNIENSEKRKLGF